MSSTCSGHSKVVGIYGGGYVKLFPNFISSLFTKGNFGLVYLIFFSPYTLMGASLSEISLMLFMMQNQGKLGMEKEGVSYPKQGKQGLWDAWGRE